MRAFDSSREEKFVLLSAGVGQSGKTTFVLRFLINGRFTVRFVFDPDNEVAKRLGLPPTRSLYDLAAHLVRGWVLFDPCELFGSDYESAFTFFCDWAYEKSALIAGEKILMVDEVWKLCPNRTIPEELARIVRTSRKRGLGSAFLTQTPNELPGVILNEVSEFVAFRLQSEAALTLAEKRGFDRVELANQPNFRFVSRTDLGGESRGSIPSLPTRAGRPG